MNNELIKAIIIDSERGSRTVLQEMLQQFCEDVEVTAVADTIIAGQKAIEEVRPDLVFLDAGTSLQDRKQIMINVSKNECKVVVVTVGEFYDSMTRKENSVEILYKPFNPAAVKEIINKANDMKVSIGKKDSREECGQ